jgi:Dolichyl-phosphate-mannose-protein mannosyltransferase
MAITPVTIALLMLSATQLHSIPTEQTSNPDKLNYSVSTRFKSALAATLAVCLALFVALTLSWPLVADASLIRSVTFLLEHHFAPYRDILEYNLPGSYFGDWLVIHTLGPSAFAWRSYDLLLMTLGGSSIFLIARRYSRFAGFYAAGTFLLFHARNGIDQTGQRDFSITVLLLTSIALLLNAPRQRNFFWFGLCVGAATTIKPTAALALPFLLLALRDPHQSYSSKSRRCRAIAIACLGFTIPPLAAILWLLQNHALAAFWFTVSELIPLHARLGYVSSRFLFTHLLTASHATIAAITLILTLSNPDPKLKRLRLLLCSGILLGLISYFIQAKGFPSHRYLFVAFLFLLASIEFTSALDSPGYRRIMGVIGLLFGLVLSILSTAHAIRDRWPTDQAKSFARDLTSLGGPALSNDIQCIDTIEGCMAALYNQNLVPSTGLMYDEFLFAPTDSLPAHQATLVADERRKFLLQLTARPPRVIVVTQSLFPLGPNNYAKLDRWPEFKQFLDTCYSSSIQRDFPPAHNRNPGYRLYLRSALCGNFID